MSASSRPTRSPALRSPSARLHAVVDFPTPPLPDATAITCRMPGSTRATPIPDFGRRRGVLGGQGDQRFAIGKFVAKQGLRGGPKRLHRRTLARIDAKGHCDPSVPEVYARNPVGKRVRHASGSIEPPERFPHGLLVHIGALRSRIAGNRRGLFRRRHRAAARLAALGSQSLVDPERMVLACPV